MNGWAMPVGSVGVRDVVSGLAAGMKEAEKKAAFDGRGF